MLDLVSGVLCHSGISSRPPKVWPNEENPEVQDVAVRLAGRVLYKLWGPHSWPWAGGIRPDGKASLVWGAWYKPWPLRRGFGRRSWESLM